MRASFWFLLVLPLLAHPILSRAADPAPGEDEFTQRTREIQDLEREIQQMTGALNTIPSNELAIVLPLQRQIREKQRQLFEKQRVLAELELKIPPKNPKELGLNPEEIRSLKRIPDLWKDKKSSEALQAWKQWLETNPTESARRKKETKNLARWIAGEISENPEERSKIQRTFVEAADPSP